MRPGEAYLLENASHTSLCQQLMSWLHIHEPLIWPYACNMQGIAAAVTCRQSLLSIHTVAAISFGTLMGFFNTDVFLAFKHECVLLSQRHQCCAVLTAAIVLSLTANSTTFALSAQSQCV